MGFRVSCLLLVVHTIPYHQISDNSFNIRSSLSTVIPCHSICRIMAIENYEILHIPKFCYSHNPRVHLSLSDAPPIKKSEVAHFSCSSLFSITAKSIAPQRYSSIISTTQKARATQKILNFTDKDAS
ncbi:hypothetical protein KY284_027855 [Solanum tuberosum]|nr:hypothetical protein KY284_027855 [Solanum tuberosum]